MQLVKVDIARIQRLLQSGTVYSYDQMFKLFKEPKTHPTLYIADSGKTVCGLEDPEEPKYISLLRGVEKSSLKMKRDTFYEHVDKQCTLTFPILVIQITDPKVDEPLNLLGELGDLLVTGGIYIAPAFPLLKQKLEEKPAQQYDPFQL